MMRKVVFLTAALALLLIAAPLRAAGLEFWNYDQGLKKAAEEKKYVMIFFWADWCRYCTQIRQEVFQSDEIKAAFDPFFVGVGVDVDNDPTGLQKKYRASVLPTLTFLNSEGAPVGYWEGAADPDTFLKILNHIKTDNR